MKSGTTASCSQANIGPVRPNPVITSSATQQDVHLAARLAHRGQPAVGRHQHAAGALDRLGEKGRHAPGADRFHDPAQGRERDGNDRRRVLRGGGDTGRGRGCNAASARCRGRDGRPAAPSPRRRWPRTRDSRVPARRCADGPARRGIPNRCGSACSVLSTASEPPRVKKTWFRSPGANSASRSASRIAGSLP